MKRGQAGQPTQAATRLGQPAQHSGGGVVDRNNILAEEKTIIHIERKKITKGQDEQTDSEMMEALLTSTRAIRNAAMEFAVKPICSSQDVDLYINRIGEHIKTLMICRKKIYLDAFLEKTGK